MRLSLAVVFLTLLLLTPALLQAEVWRCPQDSGADLFTNQPSDPNKCEKYIPSTEVTPAPSVPASSMDSVQESPTIMMP